MDWAAGQGAGATSAFVGRSNCITDHSEPGRAKRAIEISGTEGQCIGAGFAQGMARRDNAFSTSRITMVMTPIRIITRPSIKAIGAVPNRSCMKAA